MYNTLQASMATMSSFDVYKKELMGGKLEWSPSHKSENFWKVRHHLHRRRRHRRRNHHATSNSTSA